MSNPTITEMREKIAEQVSSDPIQAASWFIATLIEYDRLLTVLSAPKTMRKAEQHAIMADCLTAFKTKVQNELLASQKETNDALASALGKARK